MTSPADLGYEAGGYDLPPLNIYEIQVESGDRETDDGQMMFFTETAESLSERREARKESLEARTNETIRIAMGGEINDIYESMQKLQ